MGEISNITQRISNFATNYIEGGNNFAKNDQKIMEYFPKPIFQTSNNETGKKVANAFYLGFTVPVPPFVIGYALTTALIKALSTHTSIQSTKSKIEMKETSLSSVETKIKSEREKITKIDVSGFENSKDRFEKKAKRYLDLTNAVGDAFNAHTIMTGASKSWDPIRLKSGKHVAFGNVGAEHIELTSSTGCKVDAHMLKASEFIKNLENLGGKRLNFELNLKDSNLSGKNSEFPGIKFEKNSSQWETAVKNLEAMNIYKSSWSIVRSENAIYVVPREHIEKIELAVNANEAELIENKPASQNDLSNSRGVALLTMNQSDIYEQYPHEMLTLAFAGVDVMMYNNPGKGLSSGPSDKENINASIEACYQYLKLQNIPDEKILAKGQCFGAAPTAWLGREHPKINLMLDQNPANFHEAAMHKVNKHAESLMAEDRNRLSKWAGNMLKDNFIINGIVTALLSGYDIAEDLRYNQGNVLFNVNVKDESGKGGDEIIPPYHPLTMLDSMTENTGKITLSMSPGTTHVTDWWQKSESREVVHSFLHKTGISQPLF